MRALIRQLRPAVLTMVVFTLDLRSRYPLLSTAIGQVAFSDKADGSLIERDGVVVGSELIGKRSPRRSTSPRPSAAGDGYDGSASSGSNLGPTNPDLLAAVEERGSRTGGERPRRRRPVPVDAVTASGSGLDPHISVANARIQAPRVAQAAAWRSTCATWSSSTLTTETSACSANLVSTSCG